MKPDETNPQASPLGDAFPTEPANDAAPGAPGDAPDGAAFQPDPTAALESEKAELKDRLLRTLADMENLRRRTDREIADARAYGIAGFARDMLTVADNFQRATDAVSAEAREAADPVFKALIEGIELTERDMLKALERHGVKRLDPQGQKFDPNLHQAMFEVPDPSVPNGTVVQVVQTGYSIGDRVLRPALVGVAKGGPKAAAAEGGSSSEAGANGDAPVRGKS
jgi:molecular chaperone GrpE